MRRDQRRSRHGHLYHIFQALVRTDLLVRVGVRNEFTEAMNADFHDIVSP